MGQKEDLFILILTNWLETGINNFRNIYASFTKDFFSCHELNFHLNDWHILNNF